MPRGSVDSVARQGLMRILDLLRGHISVDDPAFEAELNDIQALVEGTDAPGGQEKQEGENDYA